MPPFNWRNELDGVQLTDNTVREASAVRKEIESIIERALITQAADWIGITQLMIGAMKVHREILHGPTQGLVDIIIEHAEAFLCQIKEGCHG